jgi:dihydroorotate dehydrogenase
VVDQKIKEDWKKSLFSLGHPLGLAAGFNKNAEALKSFEDMGFSFVEVGTVTPKAQEGNPKPRLFRYPEDRALVNRLGFNNDGSERIRQNLIAQKPDCDLLLGINLGKNKKTPQEKAVEDYLELLSYLWDLGDYFVVNVSSPNTPGLRDLQRKESLKPFLEKILSKKSELEKMNLPPKTKPLFLKLSPDLEERSLYEALEVSEAAGVDGYIVSNTTLKRSPRLKSQVNQKGGLSGQPLFDPSTKLLAQTSKYLKKNGVKDPFIIGVGGVMSGEDLYQKLLSGASLVQIYTALVYLGPSTVSKIIGDFERILYQRGHKNWQSLVLSNSDS